MFSTGEPELAQTQKLILVSVVHDTPMCLNIKNAYKVLMGTSIYRNDKASYYEVNCTESNVDLSEDLIYLNSRRPFRNRQRLAYWQGKCWTVLSERAAEIMRELIIK